jgi:hypothetical protein
MAQSGSHVMAGLNPQVMTRQNVAEMAGSAHDAAPGHDEWPASRGHDVPRGIRRQRLPSSDAVSNIRLEKPHSLSYQPITRASAPSTTAVCVASKVHDAGQ